MLQLGAALGAVLGQLGLGGGHAGAGDGGRGDHRHGVGAQGHAHRLAVLADADDLLDGLGDGVGAGHNGDALLPQAGGAADALELLDDLLGVHAGPDGHGHQAGGGLGLAGAAAGPAGVGKDLADAGLVVVDRDIEVAAADLHLLGVAHGDLGPGPGQEAAVGAGADQAAAAVAVGLQHGVHHGVAGGVLGGLVLAVVDLADVEHLLVPAAVPVDGGALAAQGVGQAVDLGHVLLAGGVGEVHRLGHGVVGVALEGGLHLHVPDGGDVVGADEDPLDAIGNLVDVGQGALLHHLFHQRLGVEAQLLQLLL